VAKRKPKPTKPTFWTHERLKELHRLFKSMSPRQLEKHFSKDYDNILQAHEFWLAHKRLKISSVQKRRTRITIYRMVPHFDEERSEYQLL
jgi:mRNA-degrading endonuclease RelE of RelBE toxin-antitoxin system